MKKLLHVIIASLFLGSTLEAAPPSVSVTWDSGRATITYSYDAADVSAQPPPLMPVPEWAGALNPVLMFLAVPDALSTQDHGSVSLLDPTSGVITIVGLGMARRSLKAGQVPPALADGMRLKITEKLRQEYDRSVADSLDVEHNKSTPTGVVVILSGDMNP